jgi:membrane protein
LAVGPTERARVGRSARLRGRLEAARARSNVLDVVLDVVEEDNDIGGGILAGALAYRLFLFLLPLALFLIAVLGLVADAFNSTPRAIGRDAGIVGLVSNDVSSAAEGRSGYWVAFSALVVLAYATRVLYRSAGVVHALAWEHSAATAKQASRSVRLFALGLAVVVALSATLRIAHPERAGRTAVEIIGFVLAVSAVWLGIMVLLPHSTARWVELLPGAVAFGVGMLAIEAFNLYLLEFVHRSRANSYGTLGVAAAALLSLFFIGRLVVAAAVLNATLFRRRSGTVV